MAKDRDNFKAGLFILVGLILALAAIFLLVDFQRWVRAEQTVVVEYGLRDGLKGLAPGADVTLGDRPIGKVTRIEETTDEGEVRSLLVYCEIPGQYTIRQDAVFELVVPTLGSGTRLNITHVGRDAPVYKPGESPPIAGALAGSSLTRNLVRDLGIRDRQRRQIAELIEAVHADVPEITGRMKRTLGHVEPLTEEAQVAMRDVREALAEAKALLTKVDRRSEVWMDRFDQITIAADEAVTEVRRQLTDDDAAVRRSLFNLRDITAQVKDEHLTQLRQILDHGRESLQTVRTLLRAQAPVVSRTLANLQLTAEQLKLAAIEVRRSPWRLLYRPDRAELHSDNIYDAARSFALGASALQTAAASLESAASDERVDPQKLREMIDYLQKLFDRFDEVEDKLWRAAGGPDARHVTSEPRELPTSGPDQADGAAE